VLKFKRKFWRLKVKNVADNIKKFQIALLQFLYTYSYYTLEEYFNQSWIMYYIIKIAYYIAISFEVLCYGTLYKYSLIVYYDLISFPCINLRSYLCIVFIKLLFLFYCGNDQLITVHCPQKLLFVSTLIPETDFLENTCPFTCVQDL
jgi:hypothetical protein